MIACVDVAYWDDHARAACVVLANWTDANPEHTCAAELDHIARYEPGNFYRRELPCLLAVLRLLPVLPAVVIVDGYVWLPAQRPGLGAHLHEALDGACTVVGVAKTQFAGSACSSLVAPVLRGQSTKPLYVTSAGLPLPQAAAHVREMHGQYRIPTALRLVDRLARNSF